MSLRACVLASGSSGNCVLVRGAGGALLVDAGLSRRDLGRRMALAGCEPDEVTAVLLTHEHRDHVGCAAALSRELGIPVCCSPGTARALDGLRREGARFCEVRAGQSLELGGLRVEAWACSHDTAEPLQFGVEEDGAAMAVCTDLGKVDAQVEAALRGRQLVVLESNHDADLLRGGPYPAFLKRRILGPRGHLSNEQCAQTLAKLAGHGLKRVVLGHLSRENNRPELALEAARTALAAAGHPDLPVTCAKQDMIGGWVAVYSGHTC
jgi:phosphoribosyl 1,2-cyclic phosphodiesterase